MIPEILEYHSNFWGASTATLNPEESIRHIWALFFFHKGRNGKIQKCMCNPSQLFKGYLFKANDGKIKPSKQYNDTNSRIAHMIPLN